MEREHREDAQEEEAELEEAAGEIPSEGQAYTTLRGLKIKYMKIDLSTENEQVD